MREFKEKEYYGKLDKKEKKDFEKLYLKYEGNEFKVIKIIDLNKKVKNINTILSIILAIALYMSLRNGSYGWGIIAIILWFIDSALWIYNFAYRHTGANAIVAIISSIVIAGIISKIVYGILIGLFYSASIYY
jgi:hypothetical protein